MKIKTIYEDEHILVLDKPVGLVVNKSQTTPAGTLQDYIVENYRVIDDDPESDFSLRDGIVHRLDKDTSGVIVIARTPQAFNDLVSQFKDRVVKKEYLAVVIGTLSDEKAEINVPIKRSPKNPMKYAVSPEGKEAVTKLEKVKNFETDGHKFTIVKAFPETGRTHQIRVHLAALNHPIVGDVIYCTKSQYEIGFNIFGRLMLHACKISFNHPQSGEHLTFESPIPAEFTRY